MKTRWNLVCITLGNCRKDTLKYSAQDIEEGNDIPWITLRIPAFDERKSDLSKTLNEADPARMIEK
jgi:hypothetical protein